MLTISTSVSRREAEDLSGPRLAAAAEAAGCEVVAMEVVPDDFSLIEDRLNHYVDEGCDLIFTTGGTGLTPDDITDAVHWVATRPARVNVNTLQVMPVSQSFAPLRIHRE